MEPLWSPVVATGGSRSQIRSTRKPQKQAKSVATGCHRLPEKFHGKEGVDGSSPSEGSKRPANQAVSLHVWRAPGCYYGGGHHVADLQVFCRSKRVLAVSKKA